MKHFKLTNETIVNFLGRTLFRIECTVNCKWAKVGQKGGYVEKKKIYLTMLGYLTMLQLFGFLKLALDSQR